MTSKSTHGQAGTALALQLLGTAMAATAATEADVMAHVAAAERAAGDDLKMFLPLCRPASPTQPTVSNENLARLIATPGPRAAAAFDNLYYLGSSRIRARFEMMPRRIPLASSTTSAPQNPSF